MSLKKTKNMLDERRLSCRAIRFYPVLSKQINWETLKSALLKKKTNLKVLVFRLSTVILFRWHNFCFKCKSGRSSVSADICFDRWTHHVPFKTKVCRCGGQRLPPPSEIACWNWENICCFNEYRVVRLSSFFLFFFFKEIIWWIISSLETQQHFFPLCGFDITSPLHFRCGNPASKDGV